MTVPPPYDPPTPPYGLPAAHNGAPDATYPAYPYPAPNPTYPYSAPNPAYPYPAPYPPRQTNAMAIASLVCAFLFAPLAILFGHLSLSQIKRSGEEGRGLAIAGLVIGYVVTVGTILALVAGALLVSWAARVVRESSDPGGAGIPRYRASAPPTVPARELPGFVAPAGLGENCSYPAAGMPAARPAIPPRAPKVPTDPAFIRATMVTSAGAIGLMLANQQAPCTVNSFVSLAQQGFFDNTGCHRLTASPQRSALYCGDPTGTGAAGPGYRFANEYPTNQYRPFDPGLKQPVRYPRGTVAMANSGPDSNGSQFFIVYRDSELPPTYTVFGRVDKTGLETVDALVAAGIGDGSDDGKPKAPIMIESIRLE